ncbi:MAG: carboxypeptidase-like regulatory domain-containing protein [Flavobacteriales bacterium]|nr:carboxypeptidase-like regulatory domain-containing protein [Flavobacteriales bacterium]
MKIHLYNLLNSGCMVHGLGIFFLFLALNAQAQSGSVAGKVASSEGPLSEASVGIATLGIGTYTTADGTFVLKNVPEGTHLLEVSLLGYLPYRDSICVSSALVSVEIRLSPRKITLEGVTVIDAQTGLDSRTPYTVSRVDARKPETTGMPGGLGSLARRDPSVYGAEMGQGIVKPFIRGLGFSRVVTVYQGAKLENRQWGADHGLGLNDLGVSHLDVIKGPASVLYGSGAVGGVLLVHDHERQREHTPPRGLRQARL